MEKHDCEVEDENARCKFCGKTIAELTAEGYPFENDTMVCTGGDYHTAVCPACLDVIDQRIVEVVSEEGGFMKEVLKDLFPQLLFNLAIEMQAKRKCGSSRDEALKKLCEHFEQS